MGGTFDPIHIAHLIAASEVYADLDLDQIIFIPAGQPWQKAESQISPAQARLHLVDLAIAADPRFVSSDIEIQRSGDTYAIDTIEQLQAENPDNEYFWIVGADALAGMQTWHRFEDLKKLVQIVCVNRNGIGSVDVGFDYRFVQIPEIGISATEIRDRVAEGNQITYLVPASVEQFIAETGLYK